MEGIRNFLLLVNDNWTSIVVIIGLALGIYEKAKNYFLKSTDEKIAAAKGQIKASMLKMIAYAEIDFGEWNKSGSIKRSQVVNEIYEKYPILSKAADQQEVIKWIDREIDTSLKTLNKAVSKK